jgi:ATP-dependent DNA ligase
MPLASLNAPFDHPDWIFELKYDGFRALAYIDSGQCWMVSRRGTAYRSFPQLCAAIGPAMAALL